jgi:FtsP/CotA-like multicopper oxidase with cupredoxin domain
MKRREFVKNAGFGVGAVIAGGSVISFIASCNKGGMMDMMTTYVNVTEGSFSRPLAIPGFGGANTTLTPQATTANIDGTMRSVLGYQANGILGPTIKLNKGDNANILLQNNLSEPNNIHWHGLMIPSNMDGYPTDVAAAGSTFNYRFTVNQRAGLYWYHPHTDMLTGSQAYRGLAGLFMVNDAEEAALNLPSGNYEIPLVLQDKRLGGSTLNYNPTTMEVMSGFMGESIVVNGVASPYSDVATRYYRLRILNGSNARIYNLAFSNNLPFTIIGSDGGLLKNPQTVSSLLLSPGERIDVLVNFTGISIGTDVYLLSKTFSNAGNAQGKQEFKIMKFRVSQSASDSFAIPSTLSVVSALSGAAQTRNFVLTEMQMSMGGSMSAMHRINDKVFDAARIDETIPVNSTENWVFENKGSEPHPIHLHAVQFQVLGRTGGENRGISASEKGWKDTVLLLPGEKVTLAVPFGSLTGKFVFHCHNLEHEDDGMMLQYMIS